jgi:hypothetical protein
MRKLLLLLAFCLLPGLAFAGSNIKQNPDGSTVWDDGTVTYPVGTPGLTVTIEDLSAAATDFVATDRPGKIKRIVVVPHGAFSAGSAEAVLNFGFSDGSTSTVTTFSNVVAEKLTIATNATGQTNTLTPSTTYNVDQGGVISIHTDGASTGATAGTVTITIE